MNANKHTHTNLASDQIIAVISTLSLKNTIPGLNVILSIFGNIKAVDVQVTFNNTTVFHSTAYQEQATFNDDLLKIMQDIYLVIASKSENLKNIVTTDFVSDVNYNRPAASVLSVRSRPLTGTVK